METSVVTFHRHTVFEQWGHSSLDELRIQIQIDKKQKIHTIHVVQ